ncbi:hypothetical protein DPMN_066507 [Dreissena polymorpha]|uniref:Uncharacterized protein n=1 Tax=Dreissena polymorpha TaxID=45954 RepID=A0A9D3YXH5_DREPO|nr:hypothetical protein DPMN_066507 [Dreissena polymorpha]
MAIPGPSKETSEVEVVVGHSVLTKDHDYTAKAVGSDHDYTRALNTDMKPHDIHAIHTITAMDIIKQHLCETSGSTEIVGEIVDIVANNKILSNRVQARFLEQINNVCA